MQEFLFRFGIAAFGIGSFVFAKKTIDKRRLAIIKANAAEKRKKDKALTSDDTWNFFLDFWFCKFCMFIYYFFTRHVNIV